MTAATHYCQHCPDLISVYQRRLAVLVFKPCERLRFLLGVSLFFGSLCVSQALSAQNIADGTRPNVLFIAVDDLNDWVGCLGGYGGTVHTPNIDRLAARGVLFTNAHCAAPVCNASRTAVMTGLRPSTSGIYANGSWWRPALPRVVTLPQWFARERYRVVGGGKVFHHTPGFNPPDQWHHYFDQVFDDPWHRAKPGQALPVRGLNWPEGFPLNRLENVRRGVRPPLNPREFDWGAMDRDDLKMGDGRMVAWAEKFLRKKHDRPFFLAAGIFRPHLPWYAPKKYFAMYPPEKVVLPKVKDNDLDDVPPAGRKMASARGDEWRLLKQKRRWREATAAYLASISFADALVGRLIAALDDGGHAENTVVVLWSDHGWHLGEKHHWHKQTLWEEATRVPLVVIAPGVTKPGGHCPRPVSLIDLYPTLIELCGLKPNERLDGQSLVPLLKRPTATREQPALTTRGRGNHAIRSERYRYIRYADGSEELYDHRTDPNEWTNLAESADHAEAKKALARWLPKRDAINALPKSAFRFDPRTYRWTRKKPTR